MGGLTDSALIILSLQVITQQHLVRVRRHNGSRK